MGIAPASKLAIHRVKNTLINAIIDRSGPKSLVCTLYCRSSSSTSDSIPFCYYYDRNDTGSVDVITRSKVPIWIWMVIFSGEEIKTISLQRKNSKKKMQDGSKLPTYNSRRGERFLLGQIQASIAKSLGQYPKIFL